MTVEKAASTKPERLLGVYIWALSYLKPYRWPVLLFVAAMTVASVAELTIPKLFQYLIDDVIPGKHTTAFSTMMAVAALLLVLIVGAKAAQNRLQRYIQEYASRDLQLSVYRHLRVLGFDYFERHPAGETLSLLNTQVSAVQRMYRDGFPKMLYGIVFLLVSSILMVATSPQLSLLIVPGLLIYYILGPYLNKKASYWRELEVELTTAENRKVYETVSALAELRAYGSQKWDKDIYTSKVKASNKAITGAYWYIYLSAANRQLSFYIGGVAIFIYGYYLIGWSMLTTGEFVSFLLYYAMELFVLMMLINVVIEQRMLIYHVKTLFDMRQLKPVVAEPEQPAPWPEDWREIAFRDVHFSYREDMPVLNGFSLTIPRGKRIALVGASGSGKSTVLKLLERFYDPVRGEVSIDGVPLDRLAFDDLRGAFGYVFQETYLFGASVRENIRFGNPDATDEEIITAAQAAYAHEFIDNLPEGYDTPVGERGIKLSGGQKQRIALARMFVRQPGIILLDEATSALDNVSETNVKRAIDRLLNGRTVVAVAHRLSTIQDFDLIAVMEKGRVIEQGSYEELMARRGAFYLLSEGITGGKDAEYA